MMAHPGRRRLVLTLPTAANRGSWWLVPATAAWAVYCAVEATRYFLAGGARGRFHIESYLFILVAAALTAGLFGQSRERSVAESREPAPRLTRVLIGLFIVAAMALYSATLELGFLSDDYVLSAEGRDGRALSPQAGRFYRPLASLLLGALGPAPVHVLNVALHGINAWLIARLGTGMGAPRRVALAAATLFLTFPAAVEAVAWASGIQDVLLTTLAMLFVMAWRSEPPLVAGGLVVALQALGLATKETAVAFPLLGLTVWLFSRAPARRELAMAGVSGLIVASYSAWRMALGGLPEGHAQLPSRWMLKEILVRVFGGLAVPWHELLGALGTALAVIAGLVVPLVLARAAHSWNVERSRLTRPLRLAAWTVAAVAPLYGMLYVARNLEGSRYLYLAAPGWFLLLAELVDSALAGMWRHARLTALTAWTLVCIFATRAHLRPWQQAAQARDAVLSAAATALSENHCAMASFREVPDSLEGAYVFRNGLPEALGLPRLTLERGSHCVLMWNGSKFQFLGSGDTTEAAGPVVARASTPSPVLLSRRVWR